MSTDKDVRIPDLAGHMPAPILLERLTYESDVALEPDEFNYLVGLEEDTLITADQLQKAVYHLRQKNKFATIEISARPGERGICLHWKLTGLWTLARLTLHGLMFGKEAYRHYYGIEPGESFDHNKHSYSLRSMEEAFAYEGYLNGTAQAIFDRDNNTKSIVVHLTLDKGKRFTIGSVGIVVRADKQVRDAELDFVRALLAKKLRAKLEHKSYSKELINREMQKTKRQLARYGYLHIAIELHEQRDNANHHVNLAFTIDIHRKREFIFVGNQFFNNDQLLDRILLFGGSAWMLPASIVQDELLDLYRSAGFSQATLEIQEEESVCVVLIQEGERKLASVDDPQEERSAQHVPVSSPQKNEPPLRFGKTIIMNNSTLPFACVMRELQYKEGDFWNQSKLKQTHSRLKALDLFETIHLSPCDPFAQDQEKTMLLSLYPNDPHELRLRVGFGLEQVARHMQFAGITYKVGGTFLWRSPLNCGDLFLIEADVTRPQRSFKIQYSRPWLFDRPIKTVVQGYNNRYIQPAFVGRGSLKSLYGVIQQGLMAAFTRTSMTGITTGLNLGIDVLETTPVPDQEQAASAEKIVRAINFDPRLLDKQIPFLLFEPTFLCDRVDNKMQPTRGMLTFASLKAMLPVKSQHARVGFAKFLVEQSFFVSVASCVLAFRLRFGHIFHHAIRTLMPSERFYLGGAYSLRSYDTDFCPPLGSFIDDCGCRQFVPQGSTSMINGNIELRFPLYKKLNGIIFQDLGLLTNNRLADIAADGLLSGSGFGLRYNTPIGPLRFDIGFKWRSKDRAPFSYAWFLTFGNAF